jgi:hypothetical protein
VRRAITLVLVLSMLGSAQARAVHWYVDHACDTQSGLGTTVTTHQGGNSDSRPVSDDPVSDDDDSGSQHSVGHCDVCGHAGMVAVAEPPSSIQFLVGFYDLNLITRESRVGDPPARRADKPPR